MANDAALLAEWETLMRSVERPFQRALVAEKNRYIRQASASFPIYRTLLAREWDEHAAHMQALFNTYLTRAIKLASLKVRTGAKGAGAPERKDLWESLWLYLAQQWVTEYVGARARETALTTRNDIQHVIDQAFAETGEFNPVAIAVSMLRARKLSRFRAETIAQTEVHNAMMFAGQGSAERLARDNGVTMLKRWVPVQDERTRINHASMASVAPIPLDADFTVGGEKMARPGDPRASGANVIRCRCVLAYQVLE